MRATFVAILLSCVATVPTLGQKTAPANETPTQFYLRYHATAPVATTIQQIVNFWSLGDRQEFNAAPAGERPGLDEIKAAFKAVSGIKVLNASETDNAATVEAEGTMDGKTVRATVRLAREKDGWKVASGPENWR